MGKDTIKKTEKPNFKTFIYNVLKGNITENYKRKRQGNKQGTQKMKKRITSSDSVF